MSVRTQIDQGVTVVSFCGCLLCDAAALEDTLQELAGQGALILLDLGEVEHLSSRTIGLLVATHRRAARHGGGFWTCNLSPKGKKLLQALKLTSILKICDTRQAALRVIAAAAKRDVAGSSPLA